MTLRLHQLDPMQAVRVDGAWRLPSVKSSPPGRTGIQWTDFTWNPIRAINRETGRIGWHCEMVAPGCANCYAARLNENRWGSGLPYTRPSRDAVDIVLDDGRIRGALNRKITPKGLASARKDKPWIPAGMPPMVFVCDMTDLFGEWVPDEMIDRVFAVMALRSDVIWQVLTKRPERATAYLSSRTAQLSGNAGWFDNIVHEAEDIAPSHPDHPIDETRQWPLPNVWLGCSVSDQKTADASIPPLLECPAAVRFVSYEPALAPVDFNRILLGPRDYDPIDGEVEYVHFNALDGSCPEGRRIDWLIVGGESGPGARRFDPAWAEESIRQCRDARVPVFVKQMGSNCGFKLKDSHGGDWNEWPAELRVREFPEARCG